MLDKIDKNKNPFKVPENYFQNFNAEIMDKLPAKENNKVVKIVPLWKKVIPWTAVAAIFAGVLLSTGILNRSTMIDDSALTAQQDELTVVSGLALSDEEDYYYAFLEEEVTKARYKDMFYER